MATEDKLEWLRERQKGIGGSDVGPIMGLSEYRAPWDVYDEKVLPVEATLTEDYGAMIRGRKLEAFAAELFSEETGMKVRRQPSRTHREHPFMQGNIDRQIVGLEGGPRILEIKVPGIAQFYQMKDQGLRPEIILQLQHYLEVYDYEIAHFVIFNAEYWDHYTFEVARDRELGQHIVETCDTFWHEHVVPRIRPRRPLPEPSPLPQKPGEAEVRDDEEWLFAADLYRQRYHEAEEAQNDLASAESLLADLAGEEATNVVGGEVKFTRYSTKSQRRFDSKAFLAEVRTRLAQGDSLDDLDPDDEAYYYQTTPSEKQKVKVLSPWISGMEPEVSHG